MFSQGKVPSFLLFFYLLGFGFFLNPLHPNLTAFSVHISLLSKNIQTWKNTKKPSRTVAAGNIFFCVLSTAFPEL